MDWKVLCTTVGPAKTLLYVTPKYSWVLQASGINAAFTIAELSVGTLFLEFGIFPKLYILKFMYSQGRHYAHLDSQSIWLSCTSPEVNKPVFVFTAALLFSQGFFILAHNSLLVCQFNCSVTCAKLLCLAYAQFPFCKIRMIIITYISCGCCESQSRQFMFSSQHNT